VPITLTNVEASGSLEYNGIYARSKGAITLNNVIANNNHWSGADLDNCLLDDGSGLCLGSGTITITNASGKLNTFNNNGRFGVWAVSKGAITVTNIQANNNGSDGASLRNNYGGSIANVTVAVSGATRNEFNGNGLNESYMPVDDYYKVGLNGLTIKTLGNISVKNVLAQNNQNEGGGIVVRNDESVTPKTVLISDCEVSGNDWHGLFVYSKGNITLTNISADTNHISGVFADNCLYDDVSGTCGGTGTVTLTNVTSNENWNRGIEVHSKGVISLTNGTALDNTGNEGVFLENRYTGSIANVTLKNITSNENNSSGVFILTNGAVTLSNITANNNHCMQGWLNDGQTAQDYYNAEQGDDRWSFYLEAGTAYTISMLGSGIGFTNLSTFVAMMKLYDENAPETPINSGQTINFTPGTSGWYYVLVNNNDGTDGLYRISLAGENIPNPGSPDMMFWVDGVSVTAGGNVTLKNGTFDDNSLSGLYAETNGNIIISNAGGSLNGGDGFDLYNNGGVGNITLTGTNLANDNGWRGIEVKTNGVLSLNNLEASNNGQHGIKIDAQGAGKAVTLKGITVMNNLLDGLNISANGKLTLNDIRSWLNGGSGAVLDTHGNALLVQSSVFMCNGEYGLEYKDYALPFTFTDKSNVYFGNTSGTTYKN
jgi:putative surface-exposed virulence protein